MNRSQVSSIERLQLSIRFEALRGVLLSDEFHDLVDNPLAYWARPGDRGLPLAFLGRSLKDLLATPFDELRTTPGIGRKKLGSLIVLLARAAKTDPAALPDLAVHVPENPPADQKQNSDAETESGGFDSATVSEIVWAQWRASVVRAGLADERLGRLTPSLQNLTHVIWNTPLGAYTNCTLADLRAMRTHGEKRIRAILEVFHDVHLLVGGLGRRDHLVLRMVPRWIDRVEQWIGRALQRQDVIEANELLEEFVRPMLEQIRIDATAQIAQLAEIRLGLHGPALSVRQAARNLGLTRARVYQLLNEVNDIMIVRWPTGRHQVYELRAKLRAESERIESPPELDRFEAAVELFYPSARRGAAGPLDPLALSVDSTEADIELEATA